MGLQDIQDPGYHSRAQAPEVRLCNKGSPFRPRNARSALASPDGGDVCWKARQPGLSSLPPTAWPRPWESF